MGVCLIQIVMFCLLGTIVDHSVMCWDYHFTMSRVHILFSQSGDINQTMCSLEFYRLPIREQRIYHYLLLHSQHTPVIRIAGVKPLNMATFLNVCIFWNKLNNSFTKSLFRFPDNQIDLQLWHDYGYIHVIWSPIEHDIIRSNQCKFSTKMFHYWI